MAEVQMILRTTKVRRGDKVVQQVPDNENPYREVVLTESPVCGEVLYDNHWVEVRYLTGFDMQAKRVVKFVGTLHQTWQILREHH